MTDVEFEPFGPEYVRPAPADCPGCPCCTAALCARGRSSLMECRGHVAREELKATVAGCPCSSESSPGSLSWRMLRVRAVMLATEKPLAPQLEVILSAVAHGQAVTVSDDVRVLIARRLVTEDGTELTAYGRRYLAARTEARQSTAVVVVDVDATQRTARVLLAERSMSRMVTVPMDQLANSTTGLGHWELPGVTLYAQANCGAVVDDDVVLTQVRNPRLPDSRPAGGGS